MISKLKTIPGLTFNLIIEEVNERDPAGRILLYVASIYLQVRGTSRLHLVRRSRVPLGRAPGTGRPARPDWRRQRHRRPADGHPGGLNRRPRHLRRRHPESRILREDREGSQQWRVATPTGQGEPPVNPLTPLGAWERRPHAHPNDPTPR